MTSFMESSAFRILLVEDHHDIAENIADYFEERGHVLDFAYDGLSGLHFAVTGSYDVIILDLMLPGMDGLTLCRRLREEGRDNTPILMLTARDTLSDKLEGFDAGADDYLVKPFALPELEARLSALLLRANRNRENVLRVSDLEMDLGTMIVRRGGQIVPLNRVCLKILQILMRASPNLVTRLELEYALWGDAPPETDALRSHIYNLRLKIDKPFPTRILQTVHGLGFRLGRFDDAAS